jgi:hypothetical protein
MAAAHVDAEHERVGGIDLVDRSARLPRAGRQPAGGLDVPAAAVELQPLDFGDALSLLA